MNDNNITHILTVLQDTSKGVLKGHGHDATRTMSYHVSRETIENLVRALEDENFEVRRSAAQFLGDLGDYALPTMLRALIDPARVRNPRLRDGVYRALLENPDPTVRTHAEPLLQALHSPVADLDSMREAARWLKEYSQEAE